MRTLSEYKGVEKFSDRSAKVVIDNNGNYGVKYILNNKVLDYRFFPEHSNHYAEDVAENWVMGIINPADLTHEI
jgi:hypothetical protein